jgi:hypothetical protein
MTSAWTGDGPVSVPPRGLAYTAGALVFLLALVGIGLGFRAAWRSPTEPGLGDATSTSGDDAVTAQPIVELPPPVTAPAPAKEEAKPDAAANDDDKAKALAAQTAAAQAVQAKSSKQSQDIDDILTSASEKPPAPVKPAADEAPPPEKSDVPF